MHASCGFLSSLFFPPISISDLAIPVPTLCESTPGLCCPVSLIAAWWTAINPWWRGWGIFMSACQQWHDTLWGWIICLPCTGSDCWVQFTWCVYVCAVWCVCRLIHSQCACRCAYSTLCVGSGALWYPEVSSRRWVLHPSLTSDKPPAHHRGRCLSSSLCVLHGIFFYCFVSVFCHFLYNVTFWKSKIFLSDRPYGWTNGLKHEIWYEFSFCVETTVTIL